MQPISRYNHLDCEYCETNYHVADVSPAASVLREFPRTGDTRTSRQRQTERSSSGPSSRVRARRALRELYSRIASRPVWRHVCKSLTRGRRRILVLTRDPIYLRICPKDHTSVGIEDVAW